jgi:dephospho-CoA kinase
VVIDADRIGHRVLEKAAVKEQLLQAFGNEIVDDGRVNRRQLGCRAFADKHSYAELNRIVQPELACELWAEVKAARKREARVVAVDAAMLFEWGDRELFDAVVVVDADEETRIQRIVQQGRLDSAEIRARAALQLPAAEKVAKADFVIDNNGTLAELEQAAENLWRELVCEGHEPG